ncbi:DUF1080 domain-containing protein [Flavivirga sp. 57AJ16]|uniref:3-keto-disaccharide hydrolase n=1 Tax=Flavivirga sp. 57AJ16 TaxID=3025307 RepID=UPI002366C11C|nr:DUF1080 domain-containing protein [Flavivirga sp. 57AJ16]MDD7885448.1 DUF1080 domain-containing protein [Flavivirga sp. 57AJ16]
MSRRYFRFNKLTVKNKRPLILFLALLVISCGYKKSGSGNASADEVGFDNVPISLFNGKDLSGWYSYLRPPEPTSKVEGLKMEDGKYVEPLGLNNDPLNVFSVVQKDGAPAIRVSGEVLGVLISEKPYENFHLSLEFKWGERKYPPREDHKRDSGIMYYAVGKEGARAGAWMRSLELQVQEGDTGDVWCVDSTSTRVRAIKMDGNENFTYHSQAPCNTFNMRGERYCQKSGDFEKEYGAWNRLDIYAYGRESIHVVNGHKNMHLTDIGQVINGEIVPLTKGKIQLQSEAAEIFFRDITVEYIESIPDFDIK